MLKAYARWVTGHAVIVLVVCALLTLLAVAQIVDLRTGTVRLGVDTSTEQILPSGDESRAFYDRTRMLFGNDDTLLLVVHQPRGVFQHDLLTRIQRLSKQIEDVQGVATVVSLSTAANVEGIDGELVIQPFFEEAPSDAVGLERLRERVFANPLYRGTLINDAADTTALVIELHDIPESEFTRLHPVDVLPGWLIDALGIQPPAPVERGIDRQIQALASEALGPDVQTWLVGSAHIKAETTRMLIQDLARVIPLVVLAMAIVSLLSFRTVRGLVLPLATIGIAVVWTLGVMVTIDPVLNMVTTSVPMLLVGIGLAYALHVVASYYHEIERGPTWDASAATRGVYEVMLPSLLTTLTTVAGFFSLVTNPLAAVRQFGLYGGIGVAFAGVAAITFVPAVLQLLSEPVPKGHAPEGSSHAGDRGVTSQGGGLVDRLLERIADFDTRYATAILAGAAGLAVVAVLGVPRIDVNSTMVSNFPAESDVRSAVQAVNDRLGGAGQINVVLETTYPKGFTEPSILKQVEALQSWLAEQPSVTGSTSILDYIKLIHRGFNDNEPGSYRIPASRNLVAQLLFFGASDETKRLVDTQYQVANVLVRTTALDSADLGEVVRRVEARLAELEEPLSGRVTGNLVLIAKTNDEIAFGQAISVGSAFWIILAIMILLFMSVRVGLIAMLPNVLPVILYFGLLGWTGVTLNVTTGLVASIVLGIAVDDTIHFLSNFAQLARRAGNEAEGVKQTMLHVGRAVTATTMALCAAFMMLTLSQLQQQKEFGYLATLTLFLAWLADLTFTPALAARVRIVTLWDVLTLDLGDDPQRSIPLFGGLSKWQARIVALMTEVVERRKGERLIQAGQKSDGMYLVIGGELRSSVERGGETVPLNRHGRGDVLGEVGLFRGSRTANVDCESDVRALRFDQENLARLQRRYPRTASKLLRNLSEVLADRLAAATARVR